MQNKLTPQEIITEFNNDFGNSIYGDDVLFTQRIRKLGLDEQQIAGVIAAINSMSGVCPEIMTTKQAAEYLGLSPRTLAIWRCKYTSDDGKPRVALPFVRIGGAVRYRKVDLDTWMTRQIELQE